MRALCLVYRRRWFSRNATVRSRKQGCEEYAILSVLCHSSSFCVSDSSEILCIYLSHYATETHIDDMDR